MLDRTVAAQILEVVRVDVPIVHLIAALAQQVADHVLTRALGAARAGDGHKVLRGRELRVEGVVHGIENALAGIADGHMSSA